MNTFVKQNLNDFKICTNDVMSLLVQYDHLIYKLGSIVFMEIDK